LNIRLMMTMRLLRRRALTKVAAIVVVAKARFEVDGLILLFLAKLIDKRVKTVVFIMIARVSRHGEREAHQRCYRRVFLERSKW
jgi:hypothetical protein